MTAVNHNPDVLSCLANLSNDEVFTPPTIANAMLDLLPQELFTNPNTTFLDPACKSGVFLREIAKRLIVGLESHMPDLQERLNHIFTKQLFGIAITELTALLSRRSLYCSKHANGPYSVCNTFATESGNIQFASLKHTWKDGRCIYCGASQSEYDRDDALESHAYEFIHTDPPPRHCEEQGDEAIHPTKEFLKMKFDVIISNPPYQLGVGNDGGNSSKAKAIYHLFIDNAIKLVPHYVLMITPSRWMTRATEGISDEWIDNMLQSNHFKTIHDFEDSSECFPGVEIKGGVNYFLWEKSYVGKTNYYFHKSGQQGIIERHDYLDSTNSGVVIRDPNAYSIINRIKAVEDSYFLESVKNFSSFVSPKDFFTNKQLLTSSWQDYKDAASNVYSIKYYLNKNIHKKECGWIKKAIVPKNSGSIKLHKVYIPAAGGSGTDTQILGFPFYGEPNSVCSQTYLVIGYDPVKHNFTKKECENIITYIKTRFFRYLVSIKKKTQNGPRGVYQFVPLQDFSKPWTDEELYKKYNLSQEEIAFIESMIRPME